MSKTQIRVVVRRNYGIFKKAVIKQTLELDDDFVEYINSLAISRRPAVLESRVMEWFFKNHDLEIEYDSDDFNVV